MAILRCSFFSSYLSNETCFIVILPDKRLRPLKALYLLHGYKQQFSSWLEQTSVARYAAGRNLAVIMPDGGRSFYTDMKMTGEHYQTYITRELPHFVKTQLGIDPPREDTAIAGLSMGGYGALKIGLSNPEAYGLIGAFSPACDVIKIAENNPTLTKVLCGDEPVEGSKHDLRRLVRDLDGAPDRPRIIHRCGDNDFMLDENRAFAAFMKERPIEYDYREEPGGHEWELWDKWVKEFIENF